MSKEFIISFVILMILGLWIQKGARPLSVGDFGKQMKSFRFPILKDREEEKDKYLTYVGYFVMSSYLFYLVFISG